VHLAVLKREGGMLAAEEDVTVKGQREKRWRERLPGVLKYCDGERGREQPYDG